VRLAEREGLETLAEGLPGLERERDKLAEQAQGWTERARLMTYHDTLSGRSAMLTKHADELTERAYTVLLSSGAETCDRCGQALAGDAAARAEASYRDEAAKVLLEVNSIEETELPRLNEQIGALPTEQPDTKRIRDVSDLIQQGQHAQQRLAALAELALSRDRMNEELQKVRAELPDREKALSRARESLDTLGPHDPVSLLAAEHEAIRLYESEQAQRRDLDELLREIARLGERLQRLDKIDADLKGFRASDESLRSEVELLSHLERACGPNGVPALILETSAIPQLEAEWNRLLRLLPTDSGDLFEVELHTQRERKTGDGAVDALDVIVYANGHARPFSTYSGGEQMRISIAQRRALSNLLAHRKAAECPLMLLDEPNSLDDAGMAALAQVLEDLAAAEGLTILVVSHDPALRDAFETSIQIEKVDGRSRIVGTAELSPSTERITA
jgi:exonuclease SbcC